LINDAFGHAEGDRILYETARVLKKCCRNEDILARVGGDEFCILLPQTDGETANAILRRIQEACEKHERNAQRGVHALSVNEAINEIRAKAGKQFDPVIAMMFTERLAIQNK